MSNSTDAGISTLQCLSDLIREWEGASVSFAVNTRTPHKGMEKRRRQRSPSSSSDGSFHDSGFASERSDPELSDPAATASIHTSLSRPVLKLLQQLLEFYLEDPLRRRDPPVSLSSGDESLAPIKRFVDTLNIPKANVWTIGNHVTLRLLSSLSSKRTDNCFVLESILQQSIKLYLTLLSGISSAPAISQHFLREVAERKTVGIPEIDNPIRTARSLVPDYSESSSSLHTPSSSNSDLSLAPLAFPSKPAHSRRRNLSLSISTTTTSTSSRLTFSPIESKHSRTRSISVSKPSTLPPTLVDSIDERESLASFSPTTSAYSSLRKLKRDGATNKDKPAAKGTFVTESLKALFTKALHRRVPSISLNPCPSPPAVAPKENYFAPNNPQGLSPPLPPRRPSTSRRATVPTTNDTTRRGRSSSCSSADDMPVTQKCGKSKMNSTLAAVEKASRLRARGICCVCDKVGSDYPRCPRCQVAWCSRQCRMAGNGGKRHVCRV